MRRYILGKRGSLDYGLFPYFRRPYYGHTMVVVHQHPWEGHSDPQIFHVALSESALRQGGQGWDRL